MSAEIQHAQHKSPSQHDAWDRIMRAHWHVRRFTENDLAEARRLLGEAIALDPTNSMAYSDLAFARHFEAVFGWGEGPAQSHAAFAEEARKAVILDDGDAAAHTALALCEMFSGRQGEARRRLQRALDLDPNLTTARGFLGHTYAFGGDCDAAMPHFDEAIRLSPRDPLLVLYQLGMGWAAFAGRALRRGGQIRYAGCRSQSGVPRHIRRPGCRPWTFGSGRRCSHHARPIIAAHARIDRERPSPRPALCAGDRPGAVSRRIAQGRDAGVSTRVCRYSRSVATLALGCGEQHPAVACHRGVVGQDRHYVVPDDAELVAVIDPAGAVQLAQSVERPAHLMLVIDATG
jgi:hypothetical protein